MHYVLIISNTAADCNKISEDLTLRKYKSPPSICALVRSITTSLIHPPQDSVEFCIPRSNDTTLLRRWRCAESFVQVYYSPLLEALTSVKPVGLPWKHDDSERQDNRRTLNVWVEKKNVFNKSKYDSFHRLHTHISLPCNKYCNQWGKSTVRPCCQDIWEFPQQRFWNLWL